MSKPLEQIRDSLAFEICHPSQSLMEHEKVIVECDMDRFKRGFDEGAKAARDEAKVLVEALERYRCPYCTGIHDYPLCLKYHSCDALAAYRKRIGENE